MEHLWVALSQYRKTIKQQLWWGSVLNTAGLTSLTKSSIKMIKVSLSIFTSNQGLQFTYSGPFVNIFLSSSSTYI